MIFTPLTIEGAVRMLKLREKNRAAMRTNYPINESDQEYWFYQATSRDAPARWWEICEIGYAGIEHIDWVARTGELSLLVDADDEGWEKAFVTLLNKGFDELNLRELHAEVFHCSPDLERWRRVAESWRGQSATIPMRKFWKGVVWDADWISWRMPS